MIKQILKWVCGMEYNKNGERFRVVRKQRQPFVMVPEWQFKKLFNSVKEEGFESNYYIFDVGETKLFCKNYMRFGDRKGMTPLAVYFAFNSGPDFECFGGVEDRSQSIYISECGSFDNAVELLWVKYLKLVTEFGLSQSIPVECYELEVDVVF